MSDQVIHITNLFNRLVMLIESGASREFVRSFIDNFEKILSTLPQSEQPLQHFFTEGLYGRQIFNPKGSVIVTKLHQEHNFSFILKGRLGVITEDGIEVLQAPKMFVTKPGTKRVLYAIEDVIFCTVHPNPENWTDLEALEHRIIAPSFAAIELGGTS